MIDHSSVAVLVVADDSDSSLRSLISYLQKAANVQTDVTTSLPRDLSPYKVLVTTRTAEHRESFQQLEAFVRAGGGWLTAWNSHCPRFSAPGRHRGVRRGS